MFDVMSFYRYFRLPFEISAILIQPVFAAVILFLLQLLQQTKNIWICDVEGRLPDAVLDVHVHVGVRQQLARLALSPVGGRVQGSPTIKILNIGFKYFSTLSK